MMELPTAVGYQLAHFFGMWQWRTLDDGVISLLPVCSPFGLPHGRTLTCWLAPDRVMVLLIEG